jgi:hypothetical protein
MRRLAVYFAFACAVPVTTSAQAPGSVEVVPPRAHERVHLWFDVAFTPRRGDRFTNAIARPNAFLPAASDTFSAEYILDKAFGSDAGVAFMATSRVGIGVSRTRVRYDDVLLRLDTIRPRLFRSGPVIHQDGVFTSAGESSSHRMEQGYHLEVSAVARRGRAGSIRAFAGPSLLKISQGLVRQLGTDAFVREENSVEARAWGYHAGADFAAFIPNRHTFAGLGFGTTVRYMRATVPSINGLDPAGGRQDYRAGGWHVSMGFRGRF